MESYTDLGYDRILVVLDGHPSQERVLDRAISMAADDRAELVVGHVVRLDDDLEVARAAFLAQVEGRVERARAEQGVRGVEVLVTQGRIRGSIQADMLDALHPDLVICGSHKESSQRYAELGSVATYIVRNASCDVLVVK